MNLIPEFQTERLILKMVTKSDYKNYHKNINDYQVVQFLSTNVPWPYPEDGVEFFIENIILPKLGESRWFWGIFLKEEPTEVIGAVDLWRVGCPENRGFWLAHKHWGKGIMSEAVKPVTDYAFNELGFEKLILSNAKGNEASRKIKEKFGATYIGEGEAQFVNPKFTKTDLWELTKENWFLSR